MTHMMAQHPRQDLVHPKHKQQEPKINSVDTITINSSNNRLAVSKRAGTGSQSSREAGTFERSCDKSSGSTTMTCKRIIDNKTGKNTNQIHPAQTNGRRSNIMDKVRHQSLDETLDKRTKSSTLEQQHQQLQQDGRRTLIKNQLHLIEQLQLENANLRNERDQLQLENEELKFQLQMISSSKQPNKAALNNHQPLGANSATLVASDASQTGGNTSKQIGHSLESTGGLRLAASSTMLSSSKSNDFSMTRTNLDSIHATPLRVPTKLRDLGGSILGQSSSLVLDRLAMKTEERLSLVSDVLQLEQIASSKHKVASSRLAEATKLSDDDELGVMKLAESNYGDSEKVVSAAIIIQRTFRKYQICKRFRMITEQLRHTTVGQIGASPIERDIAPSKSSAKNNENGTEPKVRANQENVKYEDHSGGAHEEVKSRLMDLQITSRQPLSYLNRLTSDPVVAAAIDFQQLESIRKRQYRVGLNIFNKTPEKGISFLIAHSFIDASSAQMKSSNSFYHSNQLHFLDTAKHLSSSGEKESQLSASLESCSQCIAEENLQRNVALFLLNRKGLAKEKIGQYLGNLQSSFNQGVLRYYLQEMDYHGMQVDIALRKFLATFRLPGEAQKIERIVDCFAQRYFQCQHQQQLQATQMIQLNLNSNLKEDIKSKDHTSNKLILLSKDEIFILTFAIIMLNTDLHSPSLKQTSRMSAQQFVNNLRGVFTSQTINESDLTEIYERVKSNQISTSPDHVTHVMRVQQNLTAPNFQRKEIPNLCQPHRRLVCFCRLFEVTDVNKRDRVGQHQREVFLFNDLALVTKLARRVRANSMQQYTFRYSIQLQGLAVQMFKSAYYNYGIRLYRQSSNSTVIMFNARNELDQSRFAEDLSESIAEMSEMDAIRTRNIVELLHFKNTEQLRLHSLMHRKKKSADDKTLSVTRETISNNPLVPESTRNHCDTKTDSQSKRVVQFMDQMDQDSTATTILINGQAQNWTKSSSMLNLSIAETGEEANETVKKQISEKDAKIDKQPKQPSNSQPRSLGTPTSEPFSNANVERKSSADSVFSLDSGLYLSRDASPNQSS